VSRTFAAHNFAEFTVVCYVLVPRPRPLSTVVKHEINPRLMSQTAVINATLEKIAEARLV
jgi:hypothetical protein